MPIQFRCPCGAILKVPDEHAGKMVLCPKCQTKRRVAPARQELGEPTNPAAAKVELKTHKPPEAPHIFCPGDNPEDADFFMPAPPEIAPLKSSHTSLAKSVLPKPVWKRILIGLLIGVVISLLCGAGIFFGMRLDLAVTAFLVVSLGAFICPVTIALALYKTTFRHYCAYVGAEGVAHFTCAGHRDRVRVNESSLFRDAENLRIHVVHIFYNGSYVDTSYDYTWSDASGKKVFTIKGAHHAHLLLPAGFDKYHFALAAEQAWSMHLLARILPRIRSGEGYVFHLKGKNAITFQRDALELRMGNKVQRFAPSDLQGASVKAGKIALKEPGAKEGWFSSTGVHYLDFADLANASVFLLLLENIYGITPTAE